VRTLNDGKHENAVGHAKNQSSAPIKTREITKFLYSAWWWPCFFLDWNLSGVWDGMAEYLKGFADDYRRGIKALIVISAHWEEDLFKVTGHANPELIYDYHGFPSHTYDLKWPAPGNPDLFVQVSDALNKGGIDCVVDEHKGFDHGMFIPLLLAFPDAHIPTIQISLHAGLSPQQHLTLGRLISPFRDDGVLIIGSGMSYYDVGH
jgi:aromatic ring-opening dioxygenase catalytic subunit (LigB family)